MKIFISWSGERSHRIAKALEGWLPRIFPGIEQEIFVSSELEKGISWFPQIVKELDGSNIGIICLTPESLNSTWLHFEAGALAKSISPPADRQAAGSEVEDSSPRLYTYLHQVKPGELTGPLAAYQSTTSVREDTERLLKSLGACLAREKNEQIDWQGNFKEAWPNFEKELARIQIPIQELIPKFETFFQRKTFNEPLQQCTAQSWADRYDGARQTYEKLSANSDLVSDACPRYQTDLYGKLLANLDAYTMTLKALLLKAEPFELKENGELDIPPGVLRACEDRRMYIKDCLSAMLDPLNVPKLDNAVRFRESERFAQKKVIIHRLEQEIRRRKESSPALEGLLDSDKRSEYLASSWDLDRIYYYLLEQNLGTPSELNLERAVDFVVMELETLRAQTERSSMMPLHYSLGALCALIPNQTIGEMLARSVEMVLGDVEGYITGDGDKGSERDKGRQVRRTIDEIRHTIERNTGSSSGIIENT